MKRVVSLLHRQAVRAKAEGLFFKVRPYLLASCVLAFTCRTGFYDESVQNYIGSAEVNA